MVNEEREAENLVLQLDKYWRIEADARSWNLLYNRDDKINPETGKRIYSRDATYHANLKQALVKYLEVTQKEGTDIPSLIARIEQSEKNVEAAVDNLFKKMTEAK